MSLPMSPPNQWTAYGMSLLNLKIEQKKQLVTVASWCPTDVLQEKQPIALAENATPQMP